MVTRKMCKDTDRKFVRLVEDLANAVDACNVVTCRIEDDSLIVRCPTNKIISIVDDIKSISDVSGIAQKHALSYILRELARIYECDTAAEFNRYMNKN